MNECPLPLKHPVLGLPDKIDDAEVTVPSVSSSTADADMLHDAAVSAL